MRADDRIRVDPADGIGRALDLGAADIGMTMDHLPLEVGERDRVVIDDAECADPGCCEIEQQRCAEPTRADHEHARRAQALLARPTDVAKHDMAGKTGEFVGRKHGCRFRFDVTSLRRLAIRL